jgi:hypothetical protein
MEGGCEVYINRAKALLLVGTISAGCASGNDDEGPDNPGAAGTAGAGTGGSTPSAGGSGHGGTGAGGGSGGTSSTAGSDQGGGGAGGTPSAGGSGESGPDAGAPDAGDPDASSPDGGSLDGPDAGGDAGGTPACNDTADTLVTCSALDQTDCSGLEGFLSSECEMIEFIMKQAAANVARSCMIELEPPELCVTTSTHACIVQGLGSSCPDPEADDECTTIAAACGDSPTFSECSSTLSGMTQSGRDQMVQCMASAPCDLYACIEGLTYL